MCRLVCLLSDWRGDSLCQHRNHCIVVSNEFKERLVISAIESSVARYDQSAIETEMPLARLAFAGSAVKLCQGLPQKRGLHSPEPWRGFVAVASTASLVGL